MEICCFFWLCDLVFLSHFWGFFNPHDGEKRAGNLSYFCVCVFVSRDVPTYTQKRKSVHIWTKNMGRFHRSSDGFLILRVHNVCEDAILISLNPILADFVMIFISPHQRHPLRIYHQLMQSE